MIIKVPSIACEVCGETITKAIKNVDAQAEVTVSVADKTVSVVTGAGEGEIKNAIINCGHTC